MKPRAAQVAAKAATFGGVLAGVAILYVLSCGPGIVWIARSARPGDGGSAKIEKYYGPVVKVADASPAASKVLEDYVLLCDRLFHPRDYQ